MTRACSILIQALCVGFFGWALVSTVAYAAPAGANAATPLDEAYFGPPLEESAADTGGLFGWIRGFFVDVDSDGTVVIGDPDDIADGNEAADTCKAGDDTCEPLGDAALEEGGDDAMSAGDFVLGPPLGEESEPDSSLFDWVKRVFFGPDDSVDGTCEAGDDTCESLDDVPPVDGEETTPEYDPVLGVPIGEDTEDGGGWFGWGESGGVLGWVKDIFVVDVDPDGTVVVGGLGGDDSDSDGDDGLNDGEKNEGCEAGDDTCEEPIDNTTESGEYTREEVLRDNRSSEEKYGGLASFFINLFPQLRSAVIEADLEPIEELKRIEEEEELIDESLGEYDDEGNEPQDGYEEEETADEPTGDNSANEEPAAEDGADGSEEDDLDVHEDFDIPDPEELESDVPLAQTCSVPRSVWGNTLGHIPHERVKSSTGREVRIEIARCPEKSAESFERFMEKGVLDFVEQYCPNATLADVEYVLFGEPCSATVRLY